MADQSHEDFLAPTQADPAAREPDPDAKPEPLVKVVVADWTQVALEGRVYRGGETVSAPASLGNDWIANGWAVVAPSASTANAGEEPQVTLVPIARAPILLPELGRHSGARSLRDPAPGPAALHEPGAAARASTRQSSGSGSHSSRRAPRATSR
jgi:hypothetical protein